MSDNLSQSAYLRLKEEIVTCELEPGLQVTESALAARLGISKAPLRSALARLVQDGLIIPLPRQGYRITPVTIRDADELFAMRFILEPPAARLAAGRIDVKPLRKLDAVCRAGYQPGHRASERQFLRANSEFHVAIARSTGNRRLASAIASVLRRDRTHSARRNDDAGPESRNSARTPGTAECSRAGRRRALRRN